MTEVTSTAGETEVATPALAGCSQVVEQLGEQVFFSVGDPETTAVHYIQLISNTSLVIA